MSFDDSSSDILVVDDLSVMYGSLVGLEGVSLRVRKGTIHAVVGDHGSGKSSLINAISGAIPKKRGKVTFDGVSLEKNSTRKALRLGILTLHQQRSIIPEMNSWQNIFLDREIRRSPFLQDKTLMKSRVLEAFRFLSLDADPDLPLVFYNSEIQQMVEIAKLFCFPCKLLLIDEISSKLSPKNLEKMHYLLSVLLERGTTILYATKDMEEVFNFASHVTVLRGGAVVETSKISTIDKMKLVQLTYSSLYSRKEIESQNLELLYLKNFNDNVVGNMPIPMVVADSKGRILAINTLFGKRYGIEKNAYLRKTAPELLGLPHEVWADIRGKIDSLEDYRTGQMPVRIAGVDVRAELIVVPIIDQDNSFIGTILLVEDGRATYNYDDYMKQLSQYSYERSYSFFAHEINNPLGIMANHLKLIGTSGGLEKAQEHARHIEREVKRVRAIVRRMANKSMLRPGPVKEVNIERVLREVCELLNPTIANMKIDLHLDVRGDFRLRVDPSGIRQVVLNLALNAIEAIQENGTIVIRTIEKQLNGKRYAVVEVEDNGRGIPAEDRERIFQPFFSTKSNKENHGLGLAICQDLMNQMAGFIRVKSVVKKGSLFQVYLPLPGE